VEQAVGRLAGQQGADAHGPGGLAEHGDPVGVAAEGRHRVTHPLQAVDLVEEAEASIARFHRLTGIGTHGMPPDNAADPADALARELSPALRARIEALNRADQALYDEAANLLAR
jgi:hypothetical protein